MPQKQFRIVAAVVAGSFAGVIGLSACSAGSVAEPAALVAEGG